MNWKEISVEEAEKHSAYGFGGGLYLMYAVVILWTCLLYTSPSPRDRTRSRMPSSA